MTVRFEPISNPGRKLEGVDADEWPDGSLVVRTSRWTLTTACSRTTWARTATERWTVELGVHVTDDGPRLVPVRVDVAGQLDPKLSITEAVTLAVACASTIHRRGEYRRPLGWQTPRGTVEYFARHALAPPSGTAEVERSNRPNYERVAREYLAAIEAGERAPRRIVSRLLCPNENTARQWIHRAATEGWLSPPAGGSKRGVRGPGPRLVSGGS